MVITKIAHVVGTSTFVVLDVDLEGVLGVASSYEDAYALALTLESRNQGFDFEAVYKIYPRKLGKKTGITWLKRNVKSRSRYSALLEAVMNYERYHKERGTEEQYLQHFVTWVKRFEDWTTDNMPNDMKFQVSKTPIKVTEHDVERLLLKHGHLEY